MADKTVSATSSVRKVLELGHKDVLLAMLRRMLEQVMDAEVSALCGAESGERACFQLKPRGPEKKQSCPPRTVDKPLPPLLDAVA